ncbi:MAG: class I SAM-dependent methyltransferase [Pseudomonadota bacterium]
MSGARPPGTQGYGEHAEALFNRYESRAFEDAHSHIRHLFPDPPIHLVDIGAGTGRDAAWFAARGDTAVAVEPTPEFRDLAKAAHPSPRITWLDDHLPGLDKLRALKQTFDMVMLNAVWMHLDARERDTAMAHVAALTAPGGRVFMTLRHGPVPAGRRMFEVTGEETAALARREGLATIFDDHVGSIQAENRAAGVTWTRLVFERPA